ncbi:MAG: HDOD domain-containing protein [Desulfosarcina sp.]|nr:HDOD domain-containing protein [Desulfobacterales bacterium]
MDKKRLLFVDDEPMVLKGLQRSLRSMRKEWEMSFVAGGAEALAVLREHPVDVVVSDMRMPEMDGAQLLEAVKQDYPQGVRIILSGQLDREMTLKSVRLAHQHLSKPCDAAVLREALAKTFALNNILSHAGLKKVVARIDALPSMPSICMEVMEEVQSPEASIRNVAAIIARDLGMAAKILQMVNSAFFGLCRRVTDVRDAVMLLGLDAIKALVLSVNVFASFKREKLTFVDFEDLWRHSLTTGGYAKYIMRAASRSRAEINTAFVAGMLHDIGKLILAVNFSEAYQEVIQAVDPAAPPEWEREQAVFGASHAEIGAYLMGLWGLESPLLAAIAFHHNPGLSRIGDFSPLAAVHLANVFDRERHCGGGDLNRGCDEDYLRNIEVYSRVAEWRQGCADLQGEIE